MTDYQDVKTTKYESGRGQRIATFKVTQLIWLLLGLLEAAIGLRVLFKFIAVNAENLIAALLYKVTDVFVAPFANLVGSPQVGRMVFEISSIIAMIFYLLLAWALERVVYVLFYRPRGPVTVRQTVVAEHTPPPQVPVTGNQTVTTSRTTTDVDEDTR